MNYYERHLGDYAKDTAHLSMLEHGAYGLLLDRYYGTESGIPNDQAHRICRARSRDEKAAVDAVLNEFFFLVDGVWKNNRAEEEIKKFADKKPRADEKRENDKDRQRRYRERRKAMFEELSGLGVHMAWNATTEELSAALDHVKLHPCNWPVTPPVTRDNTATQTPDTRHQYSVSTDVDTGGEPPKITDPNEIIFGYGLPLLTNAGTPEKQARSFLGGLRKSHGDDALIDKLRDCLKERPLQPLEWLAAALPPKGGRQGSRHAGFENIDYRAGVTADGRF